MAKPENNILSGRKEQVDTAINSVANEKNPIEIHTVSVPRMNQRSNNNNPYLNPTQNIDNRRIPDEGLGNLA